MRSPATPIKNAVFQQPYPVKLISINGKNDRKGATIDHWYVPHYHIPVTNGI